ncbi:GNAT family N-acetyltransferase [Candidatus Bipolaricaulota bacterium]
MAPDVYLETGRLILRRLTMDDADNLFELDSDPEVMRFLTGGIPHSREFIVGKALPHYLSYYDRFDEFGFWAAIERLTRDFMGWFHFRPSRENSEEIELGYRLKKATWARGFATEGSIALIEKGFRTLGVSKVVATAMAPNARSRRVMEKAGLQFEKEFVYPGDPFPGWRVSDCLVVKYGLTKDRSECIRSH